MTFMIALATLSTALVGGVLLVCCRRFPGRPEISRLGEWLREISTDRYRPMLRLLDNRDLEFLRTQPGFTPELGRRFRRQRCQIFEGYLEELQQDFRQVCWAVKFLMLYANADRPDLAGQLLRTQAAFAGAVLLVRLRLTLYNVGVGTVDIAGLLRRFESMRFELGQLTPAAMPSAA